MPEKDIMIQESESRYKSHSTGRVLERAVEGEVSSVGNPIQGHWVLRDSRGLYLDSHQYRNDLACFHALDLRGPKA